MISFVADDTKQLFVVIPLLFDWKNLFKVSIFNKAFL